MGWVNWSQSEADVIVLPGGEELRVDQGAGQGDVYGSTFSSLSLGERVCEHRQRFGANSASPSGAVDEWFIDGLYD